MTQRDTFSAAFAAVAVSAAQDVFEIVAPANRRVTLREVRFGQYSDVGDAAAELLSVQIIRGYTTSGSGGAAVTPSNLNGGGRPAEATVERNNTTVAQDGTGSVMVADALNVMAGWWWRPPEDERIILQPSERAVVRITAPADALTANGTLIFDESDQMRVS